MKKTRIIAVSILAALFSLTSLSVACAKTESSNPDIVRVDFVHYKKAKAAPAGKSDPGYKLLGYKWPSLPVSYVINPTNSGVDQTYTIDAITAGAEAWDAKTSKNLFDPPSTDATATYGVYDQQNSIEFGNISDSNTIAVTSIWFNKRTKSIVETDMKFNTKYTWGNADEDNAVMDIQNIATHEFGHVCGLDDLYTSINSENTMYGYSTNGETKKRSLEAPDIKGLVKIYGE